MNSIVLKCFINFMLMFLVIPISPSVSRSFNWNPSPSWLLPSLGSSSLSDDILMPEKRNEESFTALGCKGDFDRPTFARVERLCEECYQLYRVPEILSSCRSNCFMNNAFPRCIDALMISHEKDKLQEKARKLNGRGN